MTERATRKSRFTKARRLSTWRRIAVHLWNDPRDPTVYGTLEIDMRKASGYLEIANRLAGASHVTVTHLVTRAIAEAIARHPDINAIIARHMIYLRDTVDVYCQVATDDGKDLSGVKIARANEKSVMEIAREMTPRIASVHRHEESGSERTKRTIGRVPQALVGPLIRAIAFLTYDLRLNLDRFGVAFDQFGSAMVSNVGGFGISNGLAPLVPTTHVPIVLLVGEITDRPLADHGEVVIAPCMTVGCTFDHRIIDGYRAASLARIVRAVLENPFVELGLPSRSSSANDRFVMAAPGATSTAPSSSKCEGQTPESVARADLPPGEDAGS